MSLTVRARTFSVRALVTRVHSVPPLNWRSFGAKTSKPFAAGAVLVCALVSAITLLSASSGAETRPFVPPKAFHAKTYPAFDAHEDEKFSVAADPYDMPDKAAIFKVHYREEGFLPIRVIFSNDSDKTVLLTGMKLQLITVKRTKLDPSPSDDIFRRIAHLKRPGMTVGLPIPLPHKSRHSVNPQAQAEIEGAQLTALVVDPHSTVAGFVFFDVEGIDNPLAGARIFISGLRTAEGGDSGSAKDLWYFEIPMEKYLSYQPPVK